MRTGHSRGVSVLEIILVVAVLGIMVAVGFPRLVTPAARMYANDVKAQLEQARYEAIKRNAPVAVVYDADADRFETRLHPTDTSVTVTCTGSTVLLARDASEYRGVVVDEAASTWSGAVVWLPSGQGRACNGSPSIGGDIVITDGRTTRTVELTVGGRVSIR